jgi:hypothetical protein
MSFSNIRTYFADIINDVDPNFTEWSAPFDSDNIPESLANRAYWLKYDITSVRETGSTYIEDTLNVEVKFFFKLYREENLGYDNYMNLCNTIRINSINLKNINSFKGSTWNNLFKVMSLGQTGEQLVSNDKQLIITLTFEVGINQTIC